jgi:3-deoxy-D-manno-oct-2-ulosonic acid (Kdo) hydroxylase
MNSGDLILEGGASLAERLEQGELVFYPEAPFSLPSAGDLEFLRTQRLKHAAVQSISFDPSSGRVRGHRRHSKNDTERLAQILRAFSDAATGWLANLLPEYAGHWMRDRATLRTEEEAVRHVRHNDALHIDNFADRPSRGRRILRLYANINPTEPRVWQTSEKFPELLGRYQGRHRLPARDEAEWCESLNGLQRLVQRDWSGRPAYDAFMLGMHQFLRASEDFQERAQRRLWTFPPASAWVLFSDALSHAVLRGQFALEHSFFVPQSCLVCPELSPLRLIVEAGQANRLKRAG